MERRESGEREESEKGLSLESDRRNERGTPSTRQEDHEGGGGGDVSSNKFTGVRSVLRRVGI